MFQFATATRIIFGPGSSDDLADLLRPWGTRLLVVTGSDSSRCGPLLDALTGDGYSVHAFAVGGEPTVGLALAGVNTAREADCQAVVSIGGGSAIDAGKAIAALLTNPGDPLDYLEVVGRGQPLRELPAPFVAVPTTAGTGAEVTKNAVLASEEHHVKVSLRDDAMLPKLALIDSRLTHSVPRDVTAATGLDALTQVLEPYVSCKANPLTDALCVDALSRAARALPRVYADGRDEQARDDMAMVSLIGGLALANAKLGAVHGFAGPLGGMFTAPHGALCARLLPVVMRANLDAMRRRAPDSPYLGRYETVAQLLTGHANAKAEDGIEWVQSLCQSMNIPPLATYGVTANDLATVVAKAAKSSSMQGNPIVLSADELTDVLLAAS